MVNGVFCIRLDSSDLTKGEIYVKNESQRAYEVVFKMKNGRAVCALDKSKFEANELAIITQCCFSAFKNIQLKREVEITGKCPNCSKPLSSDKITIAEKDLEIQEKDKTINDLTKKVRDLEREVSNERRSFSTFIQSQRYEGFY
ncbi:MAG: hypothetical protein KR126chlam6_01211 [Candidatus Anoxychlamydiales bacterium]|nr:hypothetical protein [Candidatus Anoxychlamydiales bacterium]